MSAESILAPHPLADPRGIDWGSALARHERWLRTAVYARLQEPSGVDDVMQAVALAAVAQQAPLADESRLAPWLYRLALWQTLMYRRRAGRYRRLVDRVRSDASPEARDRDPLQWLLSAERQQMVRLALDRLARRDAEMLLLKYTEEWSYRDIARHLGVSESAVESRLHRARRQLREALRAFHSDE